jgi:hypothetical protein
MAFEKMVPRSAKRMNNDEGNDRSDGDTRISKGEEKVGGRS